MSGEWKTAGRLFAEGWSLDDLHLATEFVAWRWKRIDGKTTTKKEFFIEDGFTHDSLVDLYAAREFVRAAKKGDK